MSLQIIHKNTGVEGRSPTPSMVAAGELALNFNASGPFLTCRDTAGQIRRLPGIYCATTPPADPSEGEVWLDTRAPGSLWVMGPDGWIRLGMNGGGDAGYIAPVTISDTAPTGKVPGDLWWNSSNGQMFIYYQDATSTQWVTTNAATIGGEIIDDGLYP